MTAPDAAGYAGVLLILIAYAGGVTNRLDPKRAPSLLMNLAGAVSILLSLAYDPNRAAIAMEGAWALVALFGLLRLAFNRGGSADPSSKG